MEIFNAIVDGMTWLLNLIYNFTEVIGLPNYGLAIILLTIVIKLVLYPLTQKQMKSMLAMQQLQPKIKEIQDKWKSKDPKKAQEQVMQLYKENNVNPAAGCLPLLIQMPILIALYRSLWNFQYVNAAHASFIWVQNLSNKDPYYILPLLAGVTTYLQSKLTTNSTDPTQKMMLYTMPVFIGWISATVPAGLALYWATFNVASAVQQYFVNKQTVAIKGEAGGK